MNDIGHRRLLVKVCGLTRAVDVLICEELGVDWTGFIFHNSSPRNVTPAHVAALPRGRAKRIGVFVEQSADEVCRIMDSAGLDLAQLHGGQNQQFCKAVGCERVVKVFWPQRYNDLQGLEQDLIDFGSVCHAILLDAGTSGGGHGTSLDFTMLRELRSPQPWLLAGGLGPQSIQDALLVCSPQGVDLNSGVEDAPGKKSRRKLLRTLHFIMR
jgi:phosphoribosylanthranilate isomerase